MTVTLVTQPATMHAFKTDLDEVHSLSRYCFSYSSLGGLHLLFLYHVALKSCIPTILLHSVQGYQSRKQPTINRPKDIFRNNYAGFQGPLFHGHHRQSRWISHFSGSVRPDMKQ
jgi:hypothetical protein